jgi:hypothetical protein
MTEALSDSAMDAAKKFEFMGRTIFDNMQIAESAAAGIADVLSISGLSLENLMSMTQEELVAVLEGTEITE